MRLLGLEGASTQCFVASRSEAAKQAAGGSTVAPKADLSKFDA
jgi:hypothetical protein